MAWSVYLCEALKTAVVRDATGLAGNGVLCKFACGKLVAGIPMKLIRRLIAWLCFVGLLAFVGGGVYHFIPNRPLCAIRGDFFVHLSDDGRFVLTQNADLDELRVWNAHSGELHQSYEVTDSISILPDARYFRWVEKDGSMRVLDWRTAKAWPLSDTNRGFWESSHRGRWLTIFDFADDEFTSAKFYLFDLKQHRLLRKLRLWPFSVTKDDKLIVGVTDDNRIAVELAETGLHVATIPIKLRGDDKHEVNELFWNTVRLSTDGRWLFKAVDTTGHWLDTAHWETGNPSMFCRNAKGFEIWELSTGKRCWHFESPLAQVRSVLIAADGIAGATWCPNLESTNLDLFDATTGRKTATLTIAERVWKAEFSPDSSRLLIQHLDNDKLAMIDVAGVQTTKSCSRQIELGPGSAPIPGQDEKLLFGNHGWKSGGRNWLTARAPQSSSPI